VTEELIREDLEAQKESLDDHADIPMDYALTVLEWREVEDKIRNGDFLRLDEPDHVLSRNRRKEKKKTTTVKSPIHKKVEKLEEHKTIILEEIVNKHFSHGLRVGRVSLV
jgi:hypothetical protein